MAEIVTYFFLLLKQVHRKSLCFFFFLVSQRNMRESNTGILWAYELANILLWAHCNKLKTVSVAFWMTIMIIDCKKYEQLFLLNQQKQSIETMWGGCHLFFKGWGTSFQDIFLAPFNIWREFTRNRTKRATTLWGRRNSSHHSDFNTFIEAKKMSLNSHMFKLNLYAFICLSI